MWCMGADRSVRDAEVDAEADHSATDSDSETEPGASKHDSEEDGRSRRSADVAADALEAELAQQIAEKEADMAGKTQHLKQFDDLWENRRRPLVNEISGIGVHLQTLQHNLRLAQHARSMMPPAPGPPSLDWVDDSWFTNLCNVIVLLNLIDMAFANKIESAHIPFLQEFADNAFLAWYVFELAAKTLYHQRNMFLGRPSVVWWNWLDLFIVVSGVLDQWLLPLFSPDGNLGPLAFLRVLRIFRVMRVLRLLKAFWFGDMSWTEQPPFEIFMAAVIGVNSITMWLELDYDWPIWPYVENTFLILYTFELSVRIKYKGCRFFKDSSTIVWNILDLIMVVGGIFDLWLMPFISFVETLVRGETKDKGGGMSSVLQLLKMMRILRVLRLVRLLKAIKPLYRLIVGVMEALMAMQWVMILTLLVLYAGAITWTTLIGKGMLVEITPSSTLYFGKVPTSLFSLFKLMNGDTSVVEPICTSVVGQLMFAGFMVVANWAVLAILTSVVSDNMISSSAKSAEEDQERAKAHEHEVRAERLRDVLSRYDADKSGFVTQKEWQDMMANPILGDEILDASGFPRFVLDDMIECLAQPCELTSGRLAGTTERAINYEKFIERLDEAATPVDNRSIMHVTSELRVIQDKMQQVSDELESMQELKKLLKQ